MNRLRWQLTLSHLIAIAFTLVCMVAAVVLIASVWWGSQNSPSRRPAAIARVVASAIGASGATASPQDLGAVLRLLARGQLHLSSDFAPTRVGDASLSEVAYVVLLDPAGRPIASSTAQGASFAPPESAQWAAIAGEAIDAPHDLAVLSLDDSSGGPAVLGAAPLLDPQGLPLGAVVAALPRGPATEASPFMPLAFFGVATVVVLLGASLFALVASTLIGYLLSRRLVGRLEQLGHAAERLRGGELAARVTVVGADEVSDLQRTFNAMADDLEHTVGDLGAERDRVTGLLEARRQLVAGVSHELRTPIATLRGYLESVLRRDGVLPADVRSDLQVADREVTRLEGLIDDLFTLSRAEAGRLDLRLEPIDVGALVRTQVETQAPLAWRRRQVQVTVDVPREGPIGLVDARRVTQIVSNLLSNAVRHTPPGGLVAARVTAPAHTVRIEVRDTGEGIPPEVLPMIFERFYQGDSTRGGEDDAARGAGLGLALVKELAESMGGGVEASTHVGQGSCFSVWLPVAA